MRRSLVRLCAEKGGGASWQSGKTHNAFVHNLGWSSLTIGTLSGAAYGTYLHFEGKPAREKEAKALKKRQQAEFAESIRRIEERKREKAEKTQDTAAAQTV